MARCASKFWKVHRSSIEFPFYSRDNQEWFSAELSLPVLTELPLPADILRDHTLEFEIKVKRALTDLRECLREAIRDRDYCMEIADTLIEDIEEMSSVQESELATLRAELD